MLEVKVKEGLAEQGVFESLKGMDHEQVVFCHDAATGLKAIIAIHNTVLGPAAGGTRMWAYQTEQDALRDVLRLSRGMTYKSAMAGINFGGGKAVIIGDVTTLKTEALLRRFGKFVDSLGGKYITAEDVNMNPGDMETIHRETQYVTGIPEVLGGGGDPSPVTAYGVYLGMKAVAKKVFGKESLENKKIVVQGVGHVGSYLVDHLAKEGARLYISDLYEDRLTAISKKYPVTVLTEQEVYDFNGDIYAPCALGATLNDTTIGTLNYSIIAGAANNQLENEEVHGKQLFEQGIVYVPDFVINSGGIINVYAEYQGDYSREWAYAQSEKIYDACSNIYEKSSEENIHSHQAALILANQRIQAMGRLKMTM